MIAMMYIIRNNVKLVNETFDNDILIHTSVLVLIKSYKML